MKNVLGRSGIKSQKKSTKAPKAGGSVNPKSGGVFAPLLKIIIAIVSLPKVAFDKLIYAMPVLLGLVIVGATIFMIATEEGMQIDIPKSLPPKPPEKVITPVKPPVIYEQGLKPFLKEDRRVPIEGLEENGLNDPMLVSKLTGIGSIFYGGKRCSASVVARRNFILTASHCIVDEGQNKPTNGKFKFYSPVCDEWYSGSTLFVRTNQFNKYHDLDYALLRLNDNEKVCQRVTPFQAMTLTDEAVREMQERHYPLLALSVQPYTSIRRYREFPNALRSSQVRKTDLTALGVFCRFSTKHKNITSQYGTLAYTTLGCGEIGGASGGALMASLDGGKTYQIIATLYGSNKRKGLGFYPRIKGEYAANLEQYFAKWRDPSETGEAL